MGSAPTATTRNIGIVMKPMLKIRKNIVCINLLAMLTLLPASTKQKPIRKTGQTLISIICTLYKNIFQGFFRNPELIFLIIPLLKSFFRSNLTKFDKNKITNLFMGKIKIHQLYHLDNNASMNQLKQPKIQLIKNLLQQNLQIKHAGAQNFCNSFSKSHRIHPVDSAAHDLQTHMQAFPRKDFSFIVSYLALLFK